MESQLYVFVVLKHHMVMVMIKTFTYKNDILGLSGELTCKFTLNAALIYKNAFNSDFLQDLNEVYKSKTIDYSGFISKLDSNTLQKLRKKQISEEDLIKQFATPENLKEIYKTQKANDSLELIEKAAHCLWALARNYNNEISDFEGWRDEFNFFPAIDLAFEAYKLWIQASTATIEIKKN